MASQGVLCGAHCSLTEQLAKTPEVWRCRALGVLCMNSKALLFSLTIGYFVLGKMYTIS
jgi:hypothetical protein